MFGGATGGVTLHKEEFGFGGIAFLAIGEFAGEGGHIQRGFPAGEFARLAGSFAGQGRLDDLADDDLGGAGVFFEPFGQLFVHEVFDGGADFGGNQLVLGLAGEFRVWHLDRQHAGQAFAGVVAGEIDLFLFRDP